LSALHARLEGSGSASETHFEGEFRSHFDEVLLFILDNLACKPAAGIATMMF
jgi:hypothetical protein